MKSAAENLKLLAGMPEKTARGGINACEPPFLRELERLGVEVSEEIYTFHNDENISIFRRISQVWKAAQKFRRRLRAENFDVFHINTSFETKSVLRDAFSLFWLKNGKTKIFLKFHGADVDLLKKGNFALRFLIGYLIKTADAVGLLSSEEKRGFVGAGFAEEKFFVVKNALTTFPRKSFPHVENSFEEKPFRLIFVSRLVPTKGLIETIRAVAILREKGFGVCLEVLGSGETRGPAEDLAKALKIAEFVNFRGHVDERAVQEYYRESDLLVFPTFHIEGFPMVIFNALQFGLPVVTTRIRAAADYLRERENALFCEPKNAADVAEKVAQIIEDKDLRKRMSENNRALAEEFTAQKIAPEYLEIYRKIA
ncbi:MAG TPA: glycosyltransferase family 4 protein [Pyrinomonadaceae bacterium]